ncbi:hypothetical protein G9A89_007868 [Geosiphon pyriformis]|nr:hypothetical protein G9A89_007868 [Geosiphon pyriformis]
MFASTLALRLAFMINNARASVARSVTFVKTRAIGNVTICNAYKNVMRFAQDFRAILFVQRNLLADMIAMGFSLKDFERHQYTYILPDCTCVFDLKALDHYFHTQVVFDDDPPSPELWKCPRCRRLILRAPRYNSWIKKQLHLWNKLKMQRGMSNKRC